MKKITSILLCVCLMVSALTLVIPKSVNAEAPEPSTIPSEQNIITVVGLLGIMTGDEHGNLNLDNYVTRAEFTKMALCASSYKNNVNTSSKVSPFADIPASHWASGYVVTAVTNGILKGYADGTFKPNNNVTLEEAVTVMLRILGYSELDSGKYPTAQLTKYYDMKLDTKIPATQGQALTRRECMYLIYNCLCAETKSGSTYCQVLGHSKDSNGRIDYLSLVNSNMAGPVTVYSDGAYISTIGINLSRATVYRDGKPSSVSEIQPYDQVYYNRDIRTLWCYTDKVMGTVNSISVAGVTRTSPDYTGKAATSTGANTGSQTTYTSTTTDSSGRVTSTGTSSYGSNNSTSSDVYSSSSGDTTRVTTSVSAGSASNGTIILDGTSYKLGNADVTWKFSSYGSFNPDDFVMLLLDKDGNIGDAVPANAAMFDTYITDTAERTSVINASLKGPYTVTDVGKVKSSFSGASVYLDGKEATVNDISKYDVYYTSSVFNSVWVYSNSKAGVVNSVNVSGTVTTSSDYNGQSAQNNYIVVSGTSYYLGNEDVKYKFSAYGSIKTDDFVLLLFGKDGYVADAVILDSEIMSYLDEDEKISVMDSTRKGPFAVMDVASVQSNIPFSLNTANIYLGTKTITPADISKYDVYYYSQPFNSVWIYRESKAGIVNSVNVGGVVSNSPDYNGASAGNNSIIVSGTSYSLGSDEVKNKFSAYGSVSVDDFVLLLLGNDKTVADAVILDGEVTSYIGEDEKISIIDSTKKGPYAVMDVASVQSNIPFSLNTANIYLGTKTITPAEISKYDVYYYSQPFNSVWIYRESKAGIVNSVNVGGVVSNSPDYNGVNAGNNSIVVSGTSYSLGSDTVKNKFSAYGSVSVDDFVLLLLGSDKTVADAVILDSEATSYIDEKDKISVMDSTRKGPYAVMDVASVQSNIPFSLETASIYLGTKTITPAEISKYDVYYYSQPFNSVWIYRESKAGIVNSVNVGGVVSNASDYKGVIAGNNSIVVSGTSYSLGSDTVKNKFSAYGSISVDDFVLLLLGNDKTVADAIILDGEAASFIDEKDRVSIIDSTRKGPYAVTDLSRLQSDIPFSLEGASIYYGTKTLKASDIALYDVYYYSEPFNSVWIYRDNVIGIVDSVNVSGVTSTSTRYSGTAAASGSIIVSGKSYVLGNDSVTYKFSAYGSYGTDDFVMVLLDKDGKAADVVVADSAILEKFLDEDDDRVALINSTLKGPYIIKDGETLEGKLPFDVSGMKIYHGTKAVSASYAKTNDVYYYSEPFASVWIYRDTATGFVNSVSPSKENPTSITVGSKVYSLDGSTIKQQFSNFGTFEVDDFVTILLGNGGTAVYATAGDIFEYAANNKDGVTYTDLVNQSMDGPIVAKPGKSWKDELPFDYESATYYRKNAIITASQVQDYDVLYYSKALSSVWVYADKATGIFESASPNRISPTSVTISGKTYTVESTGAAFALSNMGTYSYGDTITVLLGKNGGVVEVISGSAEATTTYGFITAFGEGTYTKPNGVSYTAENITILGTDTNTYVYEYDDSGFTKGDFVSVTFVENKVKLTKITNGASASVTSSVNALISSGSIADDAVLMDVYITIDSDSLKNKSVKYCTLFPARLSGAKLKSSDIYYAKIEDDRITELILNDFTGDIHTYGVLATERNGTNMDYHLISAGNDTVISVNTAYGTPTLGAVSTLLRGGKYIVTNLKGVAVEKSGFGRGSCTSDGKVYSYASTVEYYIKESARVFTPSTYEDIMDGSYKITAYYDDTEENGGRVRIIIAE